MNPQSHWLDNYDEDSSESSEASDDTPRVSCGTIVQLMNTFLVQQGFVRVPEAISWKLEAILENALRSGVTFDASAEPPFVDVPGYIVSTERVKCDSPIPPPKMTYMERYAARHKTNGHH